MRESATTESACRFFESTPKATTRAFVSTCEALHAVLPEQRVLGQLACERRAEARQLLESCVDEPPLERRHDDHVGGAERAGDDPDEDEDDADPDSARERHAVTPTGSDSPRRAS